MYSSQNFSATPTRDIADICAVYNQPQGYWANLTWLELIPHVRAALPGRLVAELCPAVQGPGTGGYPAPGRTGKNEGTAFRGMDSHYREKDQKPPPYDENH